MIVPHIRLMISWYNEIDTLRKQELHHCLFANLTNHLIDEVVVLIETNQDTSFLLEELNTFPNSHKIAPVQIKTARPTFDQFLSLHNTNYDIRIIANSDIVIPQETISRYKDDFHKKNCVLCLTRWDWKNGSLVFLNRRDSQDTWFFAREIRSEVLDELKEIPLGIPGCDNRLAYVLWKHNLNPINPSKQLTTFHFHESGKLNYDRSFVIPPPYHYLTPE